VNVLGVNGGRTFVVQARTEATPELPTNILDGAVSHKNIHILLMIEINLIKQLRMLL
jgi:hypothetical protein